MAVVAVAVAYMVNGRPDYTHASIRYCVRTHAPTYEGVEINLTREQTISKPYNVRRGRKLGEKRTPFFI